MDLIHPEPSAPGTPDDDTNARAALDDDLTRFIEGEIAAGRHSSHRDVIAHALRTLRDATMRDDRTNRNHADHKNRDRNDAPAPEPVLPNTETPTTRPPDSRAPETTAPDTKAQGTNALGTPTPDARAPYRADAAPEWHSAEHLAVLRESDAIGFFTRDGHRGIVQGDPRYAALLGIDPNTMARGVPLAEMAARVHPDDRAAYLADAAPTDAGRFGSRRPAPGQPGRYLRRFRITGHDGRMLHLLARGTTQADTPLRSLGVVIDTTELRDTEIALAASEELNRRILENSPDCIEIIALDGRLLSMSDGGRIAMEIDDFETVRGRPWRDFWASDAHAPAERALDMARKGDIARFHGPAPTAKGNPRVWDVVVIPIRDTTGQPDRLLAISRDITRLHHTERALADSETHWRSLFMNLQEGFMIGELVRAPAHNVPAEHGTSPPSGGDATGPVIDWRYIDANPALGHLLGIPTENLIGRTVRTVLPGIQESWIEDMATVVATNRPVTFLRPFLSNPEASKPGARRGSDPLQDATHAVRWYEGHALPTGGDRFAVMVLEVTERLRNEARQNALLSLADRLRDVEDPTEVARTACEILADTLNVAHVGYADVTPHPGHADATPHSGPVDTHPSPAVAAPSSDRPAGAPHASSADPAGTNDHITIAADWAQPGHPPIPRRHALRDYGSYVEDLVHGRSVIVHDTTTDPRTAGTATRLAALAVRAFVNLPLMEDKHFVALLFLNTTTPRVWTEQDITFATAVGWRMRATIERRRAEARIRNLASTLGRAVAERTRERDSMWRLSGDLMGVLDESQRLIAVNEAWTRMLGWSETDIVGHDATHIIHPDHAAATARIIAALRHDTSPPDAPDATPARAASDKTVSRASGATPTHDFENRVRTRSGAYRVIAWHAATEAGRTFLIGRDVTAQRETEDALRQAQKMEAVGQLTGGLAHDFNNLLTGITGGLELLRRKIDQTPPTPPATLLRYVDAAHGAALRAAALTHRLLAFSRRQTLDPKPVDLNRLIDGMEDLIRRTIGSDITLDILRSNALRPVRADAHQVENALLNLCINARDAMPDGGRLTIATSPLPGPRTSDMAPSPHGYACLSVTDTGEGMTPDIIARAFDPFFTTKPIGRGTGLGLSMVYGFARQSGGHAHIRSSPGHGTTVSLDLPLADERTQPPPPLPEPDRTPDRTAPAMRHILLVDDEPTIRTLSQDMAQEAGHSLRTAADANAAIALLDDPATAIDLLVTDVGLPGGMNGRQLADYARTVRPMLPILFITGYAEHTLLATDDLHADMHVLTKPFPIRSLIDRIEAILANPEHT